MDRHPPVSSRGPRSATLLLVRHGETEDNVTGRLSGARDVPLTATGRRQAQRLAVYLTAEFTINAIYTSPLSRAAETAQWIGRKVGLTPIPLDGLREWALGRLEGRRHLETDDRNFTIAVRRAGGETRTMFRSRVLRAMELIASSHPGQTVAVVTHGGPLAAYLATTLRGHAARWSEFKMNNAALTVVTIGKRGAWLDRFNSCPPAGPACRIRARSRAPGE